MSWSLPPLTPLPLQNAIADGLREGLGYYTISSEVDEDNEYEQMEAFNEFLTKRFSTVHSHPNVNFALVNSYSRFYRVQGTEEGTTNPYLLMGHLDVVPPGDSDWQCDPFTGRKKANTVEENCLR